MGQPVTKWAIFVFEVFQAFRKRLFNRTILDPAEAFEATNFCSGVHAADKKIKRRQVPLAHDDCHDIQDFPIDVVEPSEEVANVEIEITIFAVEDAGALLFKEGEA